MCIAFACLMNSLHRFTLFVVYAITMFCRCKASNCQEDKFGKQCRLDCHCLNRKECKAKSPSGSCKQCSIPYSDPPNCQRYDKADGKSFTIVEPQGNEILFLNNDEKCYEDLHSKFKMNLSTIGDFKWLQLRVSESSKCAKNDCQEYLKKLKVYTFAENNNERKYCTKKETVGESYSVEIDCPKSNKFSLLTINFGEISHISICKLSVYACSRYTYGSGSKCDKECDCEENCDSETGACTFCKLGRFWKKDVCDGVCHCKDNRGCSKDNGRCTNSSCLERWDGQYCQKCRTPFFGIDCTKTCHCYDDAACDQVTGECPSGCASGYEGKNCQIATETVKLFIILVSAGVPATFVMGLCCGAYVQWYRKAEPGRSARRHKLGNLCQCCRWYLCPKDDEISLRNAKRRRQSPKPSKKVYDVDQSRPRSDTDIQVVSTPSNRTLTVVFDPLELRPTGEDVDTQSRYVRGLDSTENSSSQAFVIRDMVSSEIN